MQYKTTDGRVLSDADRVGKAVAIKSITEDGDCICDLVDMPADTEAVTEALAGLAATDYIAAKMADALMDCETADEVLAVSQEFGRKYKAIRKQRQEWRNTLGG